MEAENLKSNIFEVKIGAFYEKNIRKV